MVRSNFDPVHTSELSGAASIVLRQQQGFGNAFFVIFSLSNSRTSTNMAGHMVLEVHASLFCS